MVVIRSGLRSSGRRRSAERWAQLRAAGPRGVRPRLVLIAVLAVTIALMAGGGLLLFLLQANLRASASAAASSRATEVALVLRTDGVASTDATLRRESRSGQVVQIVDDHDRVVAASSHLADTTPLSGLRPADGRTRSELRDLDSLGTPGDWILVARGTSVGAAAYTVLVAVPVQVQAQTVQTVAVFLLGATPVLLLVVALAVWVLVGRTLRPVEQIRRTVAAVDARRLAERVPVPSTGDEITALALTMNVMLTRLQSADQVQRAFISDAGHELRSPLAAVTAALEVARDADEPTRSELITTMAAEVDRMGGLVEDLTTLARADADRLIGDWGDVDLDDVVEREVRRLRTTSRHRIEVSFVPVRLSGDERRLTQVLRNLLDNAERYAGDWIRVELMIEDRSAGVPGTAVLRVDNDGPVVPLADRTRIFERFVRLDESRDAGRGGRGLGLAISQRIVEAHGGRIEATEGPDRCCRFEVRLPAAPGPSPEDGSAG